MSESKEDQLKNAAIMLADLVIDLADRHEKKQSSAEEIIQDMRLQGSQLKKYIKLQEGK